MLKKLLLSLCISLFLAVATNCVNGQEPPAYAELANSLKEPNSFDASITLIEDFLKNDGLTDVDRIKALNRSAEFLSETGQLTKADERIKAGITLALKADKISLLMWLYQTESIIACQLSDYERGVESATRSIELAEKYKKPTYAFFPLIERAINLSNLNQFEPAIADFNRALEIAETRKSDSWKMRVLCNLAPAYGMMKQRDREEQTTLQALTLAKKFKNTSVITTLTVNLANNYIAKREWNAALELFEEARDLAIVNNNKSVEAIANTGIGDVLLHKGQLTVAKTHFEKSNRIYAERNDRVGLIQMKSRLLKVAKQIDGPGNVVRTGELGRLVADAKEVGNQQLVITLLDQSIGAHRDLQNWEKTSELLLERQAIERDIWKRAANEANEQIKKDKLELSQQRSTSTAFIVISILLAAIATALAVLWILKRSMARNLVRSNAKIQLKQQQKLLRERELAEREKVESLTMMSAGIVHDFNNFLSAIVSTAEVGRIVEKIDKKDELFESILKTGMSAADLTRNLSDYLGQGKPAETVCELNQVVAAEESFLKQLAGRSVNVHVQTSEFPAWVNYDAVEIKQIVSNLVKNSSESINNNAGQIEVTVACSNDNDPPSRISDSFGRKSCCLMVTDNGCGMTNNEVARATDPFFSKKGIGRGLGLASVKGVVERNDGEMSITSTPGKGTEIVIEMPLVDARDFNEFKNDELNPDDLETLSFERVLFVEDNEKIRCSVVDFLRFYGVTVETVDSAEAAIALIRNRPPFDCVITDYLLPDQSGHGLAERIKDFSPELPIILVSGYAEQEVFKSDVFEEFIPKPFRFDKLLNALRRLQSKRAHAPVD